MVTEEKKDLDSAYSFENVESKWLDFWLDKELFKSNTHHNDNETFSIALPPPNVTGELHMGHALSGTIQDVLIRYHRMRGRDVHWQIGSDHAGIGTQIVVENFLKKNGQTKNDLGRKAFVEKVKEWKEEYGNKIVSQMKRMGFSADYSRVQYTMNDDYSKIVKSAFIKYLNAGYIYKGKRLSNWCPHCLTSLSDLEINQVDKKKSLYSIKYLFENSTRYGNLDGLVVATTRPETMFGDTAVAINPEDERYTDLIQAIKDSDTDIRVVIPFINKPIKIILDTQVKIDFGTGALKVTPAHDFNDSEIGIRHQLEITNIFDDSAKLVSDSELIPEEFKGLDRYQARKAVVEKIESLGILIDISEYTSQEDQHDRCGNEIEPYLSDQWYLDMKVLARRALDLVIAKKEIEFLPTRYTDTFATWLENIQDWCISRQIWWGHRIPVFYYEDTDGEVKYFCATDDSDPEEWHEDNLPSYDPSRLDENGNPYCLKELKSKSKVWMEEDVLDTWFSSALWPFASMSDDKAILDKFYPTSVLATAREIINLWVTRMIFSSDYFNGEIPFSKVLIHPVVQTPDGKRMSKSKGNAIDPIELVDKYGADACRMWYASVGVFGNQDVKFPGKQVKSEDNPSVKTWECETIEKFRKFNNKIYNAAKFLMMNLQEDKSFKQTGKFVVKPIEDFTNVVDLTLADRWILDRFHKILNKAEDAFTNYDLSTVQETLYEFVWLDFCDWYIEFAKIQTNVTTKNQILFYILEASLRALSPIVPFVTEEIWQVLISIADLTAVKDNIFLDQENVSIVKAVYPQAKVINIATLRQIRAVDLIIEAISKIRNVRQSLGISWSNNIDLYTYSSNADERAALEFGQKYIKLLTRVENIYFQHKGDLEKPLNIFVVGKTKISVPLAGIVDIAKLRASIVGRIEKIIKQADSLDLRLKSPNFVSKAPPEKVQETREELKDLNQQKDILEQ